MIDIGERCITRASLLFGLLVLASGQVPAAPALPLTHVAIYQVLSQGCVEDVSDGRSQTRCAHRGPNITVTVVEQGIGAVPQARLDGVELQARREPLCVFDKPFVPCGRGAVVGYRYSYDLGEHQAGQFSVSNRSLAMPARTLGAEIRIN